MPYGQGDPMAALMKWRGAESENAPEPVAATLWVPDEQTEDQVDEGKHGVGLAVERTNGQWSKPQGEGKRSFESAMNYLFSEKPPMAEEMGNGEFPH